MEQLRDSDRGHDRRTGDERRVVSGLLNLFRNLGLVTGASVMGAVFAHASSATDLAAASAELVAGGMRVTFGVAALLIGVAIALAAGSGTAAGLQVAAAKVR